MPKSTTAQVLADAAAGKLTNQELSAWIESIGPSPTEVQRVLNTVKRTEPHVKMFWTVQGGQILSLVNNPATQPLAPSTAVGTPLGNTQGGQIINTQDWQHLFIRLAEFGIGALLVAVGVGAVLRKTPPVQEAKNTVIRVAGVVPK